MWFTEIARVENPGRNEWHGFIDGVERFLAFILEQRNYFGFLWADDPELHPLALNTFRADVADGVKAMHGAIESGLPERLVAGHGLAGRPMHFKLRVVDGIARRWEKFRDQFKIREWLRQIFEAVDAVLDSLIDAAGGAGALIKEFKDALCALAGTA